MRSIYSVVIGFVLLAVGTSEVRGESTTLSPQGKSVMNQFLIQFLELQGFMASVDTMKNKAERDKVSRELQRLAKLSLQLRKIHNLSTPSFQISAELLTQELQGAARAFSNGNLSYARRSLRSTLDVCSSCHSQVPGSAHQAWIFDEKNLKGSDLQRAEFLFATRQYGPALQLYRSIVESRNTALSTFDIDSALARILAIQVRLHRNPRAARAEFDQLLKDKKLPENLRARMESWNQELRKLERLNTPDLEKVSAAKLVDFVSSRLGAYDQANFADDSQLVPALYFSGLLYQFINTRPVKDLNADSLFWLAHYESRLGEYYPIELSRLYLKECVLQFSSDLGAQRCFNEYESLTNIDYTGSMGTRLPPDVKKEIEALRLKVETAKIKKQ